MLHFQAFTRHVGSIALCARSKCLPTIARRSYSVDGEPKTAIEELSQLLNDNDKRKLRYIKNEVSIGFLNGSAPNPDHLTLGCYQHLLTLSTNQRQSHYIYLKKVLAAKHNTTVKQRVRLKNYDTKSQQNNVNNTRTSDDDSTHITYGVNSGSLFTRFPMQRMSRWGNLKLARHIWMDEPKIIFDCGFENRLTHRECKDTANQLLRSMTANRSHINPFLVHLYNLDPCGLIYPKLLKCFPDMKNTNIPAYLHTTDYTEEIPKEKLVILTDHSPNMLQEFDSNVTYVLGAIVDRSSKGPCMMGRAKELNIQTARLPFDLYRRFHMRKNIPLNNYMSIMLDVRSSGSWDTAFNCLSKRFFK